VTKECYSCREQLSISMFTKQKDGKFGVRSRCKKCLLNENYVYNKSRDGVATQIYTVQKLSSKKRGMEAPLYSKDEFKKWLFSHSSFEKLYEAWVESRYNRSLAVSVNRLDDYIGYRFDNIELGTWYDNRNSRHSDVISGRNNKQSTAVLMYSKDGEFIRRFHSMHHAKRETGINASSICNACKGNIKTAGKHMWKYDL